MDGGREGTQLVVAVEIPGARGQVHGVQRSPLRNVQGNKASGGEILLDQVPGQHLHSSACKDGGTHATKIRDDPTGP